MRQQKHAQGSEMRSKKWPTTIRTVRRQAVFNVNQPQMPKSDDDGPSRHYRTFVH